MNYNSAHDELFLADYANDVVRMLNQCDNRSVLRDVYTVSDGTVCGVCHINDSDTLLVCSGDRHENWLVALSRCGNEWRETQRAQTEETPKISCALSDLRVLIGKENSQ